MKKTFGIILILPFIAFIGLRAYKDIAFDIDCGGHLKRAADANSIELAEKELSKVINYLEDNDMTTGYTSIMYKTPDEDVGFWYQNLKVSLEQLQSLPPNCSELEKSNMLIKLRETLLDHGESAENTTSPDGISIFPNNNGWLMFGLLSFLAAIGGIILFNVGLDEY